MGVSIVTDSTAYLLPEVIQELHITVLPHHIRIGDREYLDGVDLDEDVFRRLVGRDGLHPIATSPTQHEFHRVYTDLNQGAGEIISIHVSDALSGAVRSASQAASMLLGRCKITVLDSRTISLGLGILVEAAARAAAEGQSYDDIVRLVRGIIPHIYVVLFSESLDYLERGGRIGHAQALLGTMLGIKPFLTIEDGEIQPMEKVRTREEALEKLVEFVAEFDQIKQIAIIKSVSSPIEEIPALIERLDALFPNLDIPVIPYGPVLASHIGPDTLGITVYEEMDYA